MRKYKTEKSKELFKDAWHGLPGGMASSLHKASWQEYPIFIEKGEGSKIIDVDGNEYIDYMLGFGPAILGYSPEVLNDALNEQLLKGVQFAAPTESLNYLSKKLIEIIPSAEKVSSFNNSGSEANANALRLARAFTGKNKIIKFEGHYHGWLDELKVSAEAPSAMVMGPRNKPWVLRHFAGQNYPENIIVVPYNDLDAFEQVVEKQKHEVAGVIMETIMLNAEPVLPKSGFIEAVREITRDNNILLIFDEIITGFRLALGGAQEYYNVIPDISVFGKAIAGGFPISAVVGKTDIVNSGTAPLGTFNGNPFSVAAALTTISELEKHGCYDKLNNISSSLVDGINELGDIYNVKLFSKALGAIWILIFGTTEPLLDYRDHFDKVDKLTYRKVCQAGLEYGVRFNPFRGRGYVSTAHTLADVKKTLNIIEKVFAELNKK